MAHFLDKDSNVSLLKMAQQTEKSSRMNCTFRKCLTVPAPSFCELHFSVIFIYCYCLIACKPLFYQNINDKVHSFFSFQFSQYVTYKVVTIYILPKHHLAAMVMIPLPCSDLPSKKYVFLIHTKVPTTDVNLLFIKSTNFL